MEASRIVPGVLGASPFDRGGTRRDGSGAARYLDLVPALPAMLAASVARDPDASAVVEVDGPRVTYSELWERASRVSGGLRAAGVRRGDRVALRAGNGLEWVLGYVGALLAGAAAVPVNTRLTETEAGQILADCAPLVVLAPGAPLPDGYPFVDDDLGPADLAEIFYTSGTTGRPKGAMISHGNCVTTVETTRRVTGMEPWEPGTRTLISVPLFHVTGCNSQLLTTLGMGGTSVIMPAFEVRRFLRAIAEEGINRLSSVPAIYQLALNSPHFAGLDTSGVRTLTYGGAPMPPELVHALQQAFPLARVGNGFGMSETTAISTFLPHEWAAGHADSVGFAAPVTDVAIWEPDPRTGVGELLVRGPNVVSGYWNDPVATAAAFTGGWLHTGDLARIDDDGLVHIVDRAKDMINRGGENVYCVEVENALAACPGVGEVAVLGVTDAVMGEKVGAVVVPSAAGFDIGPFLDAARRVLADYKVPQFVVERSEPLPRNAGGKVVKSRLRAEIVWGPPLR